MYIPSFAYYFYVCTGVPGTAASVVYCSVTNGLVGYQAFGL